MKRLLSSTTSELFRMNGKELKQAIKASEGRTIVSEVIGAVAPLFPEVTNGELAASFGADILLVNGYDVFNPVMNGLPEEANEAPLALLKELTGRPIGINLEPVDQDADLAEAVQALPEGRTVSERTLNEAKAQGVQIICLTGNPQTGVTNRQIEAAIGKTRRVMGDDVLIIAGKMHGAGVSEDVVTDKDVQAFTKAGADVILLPAPGTVPGVTMEKAAKWVGMAKEAGALTMLTIGTSQEGADEHTVRQIGLWSKMAGADMHHIGDAGYLGIAVPENIMTYSTAIRGRRHTMIRMARSIKR